MKILALIPTKNIQNGFSIAAKRHIDLLSETHTIISKGNPKDDVDAVYVHTGHSIIGCVPPNRLGKPVVGYRCVESSKANPDAADELNKLTQIWTPSEASAAAIIASGTTTPVFVVPHPIKPPATPLSSRDGQPFTVLTVSAGPLIRKAPELSLSAFQKAFPIDDYPDVRWILKIRSVAPAGKKIAEDLVAQDPRATLIHKDVEDIYAIYGMADVLLHLHHAGAFEMCCAEAAIARLPVLTTDVGGVKDYLPKDALISSTEITHKALNPINMAGTWQLADVDIAAAKLLEIYTSPEKRSKLADKCYDRAVKECGPEKVAAIMNKALAKLPKEVEVSQETRDDNKKIHLTLRKRKLEKNKKLKKPNERTRVPKGIPPSTP
jgi:glycosyltransferase involved in cell wall biosynthesis